MKSLNWFKNRIGKRIYRDRNDCHCLDCEDAVGNGLIVRDKNHAEYLHMIQGASKIRRNYFKL